MYRERPPWAWHKHELAASSPHPVKEACTMWAVPARPSRRECHFRWGNDFIPSSPVPQCWVSLFDRHVEAVSSYLLDRPSLVAHGMSMKQWMHVACKLCPEYGPRHTFHMAPRGEGRPWSEDNCAPHWALNERLALAAEWLGLPE